jgi:hypothetical protein
MSPILFLSLMILLAAALPWWPYSVYARSRHHRPWDWLLDTPSREDCCIKATETGTTKIFDERGGALGRGPIPEASQRVMTQASQRAAMKLSDSNSETHLTQGDLLREFEERWFALERQTTGSTYGLNQG